MFTHGQLTHPTLIHPEIFVEDEDSDSPQSSIKIYSSSLVETVDPLVTANTQFMQSLADLISPKVNRKNISIRGVKVSDKKITLAPELNVQLSAWVPSLKRRKRNQ